MSQSSVHGKNIVITGAASGIGAHTAMLLAERGANLFVGDINVDSGETLVRSIRDAGGNAFFQRNDVSNVESVVSFFDAAIAKLGHLDVAINNAGVEHKFTPMHELSEQQFQHSIAVNLTGVWHCMKQEIIHMLSIGGGHIINISSVAGLRGAPMISAYGAAKHGVVSLTKSAAIEYARSNIRVNVVCPSFVDTPMVDSIMQDMNQKQKKALINFNPMKRLGKPEEVSTTIAWMCNDESTFMTGHSVVLDGGLTA